MNNSKTAPYLASRPGDCCARGSLHDGEPRGRFETVDGVGTYIVEPPEGSANGRILMYFADIYGMFTNGLLVMDTFADAGYLVLGPDYFRGDPIGNHRNPRDGRTEPGFDREAWLEKHKEFADTAVPLWTAAIKAKFGRADTRYACVGYCFGAPYVCDALATEAVSAGAIVHPAYLEDRHFAEVKKPLFLSCCDMDHTFPADARRRAVDILREQKKQWQLQLFPNVEHGFALRGDLNDPYQRFVKEASLAGVVDWFNFWLSQGR